MDVVGRLDGDGFAVLLPRCDKGPALEIAQRLRLQIAESRIATDDPRNTSVHVSGGVAALRPLTRDFNELMRHADAAMFKAKSAGRNEIRAGRSAARRVGEEGERTGRSGWGAYDHKKK